jgi:hypothetical protein
MVWRVTTGRKMTLIGLLIAGALVAGLFGLHFYLRASAARYRAELVRKGEKLEISELLPRSVNSDSNGAPALMVAVRKLPKGTNIEISPIAMKLVAPGRAVMGWRQPDLRTRSSEETNTWEELAQQCRDSAAALDEIHAALQLPEFDFNVPYLQGFSALNPHLSSLKMAAQRLKNSTMLHLHEGNLELAFRDLQSLLALCRTLENEPLMISQLVHIACISIALSTTWEALQADGSTDAQLLELQRRWEKLRILEPCAQSFTMERAMMLPAFEQMRHSSALYKNYFNGFASSGGSSASDPLEAVGEGFKTGFEGLQGVVWSRFSSYNDERRYLAIQQVIIEASREPASRRFYVPEEKRAKELLAQLGYREEQSDSEESHGLAPPPDIVLLLTPVLMKFHSKGFAAETQRELAVVAIAIKRYQLRHGSPPSALEVLAPEFLAEVPLDRMDGKPLRYRMEPTGGFLLYSVGSDGVDDGGNGGRADGASSPTFPTSWLLGKDWVWPQPANREEVENYNATTGEEIRRQWEKRHKDKKQDSPGN